MIVEYYRNWPGNQGDAGRWDTDLIEIPNNTPDNQVALDLAVRKACENLKWEDDTPPHFVGFYAMAEDPDQYDPPDSKKAKISLLGLIRDGLKHQAEQVQEFADMLVEDSTGVDGQQQVVVHIKGMIFVIDEESILDTDS